MSKVLLAFCFMFIYIYNVFGQVFISCKKPLNNSDFIEIKEIDKNAFLDKQHEAYRVMKTNVKKIGKSLIIVSKTRGKIIFTDKIKDIDDVDQKIYEYIGMISGLNLHIIREKEYEWSNYIIVSANNGKCVRLWNMPIVSPDGKKLLAYSANLIYDPMPNGIQIVSIERGVLNCVSEYTTESWEPSAVAWRDNESVYIKKRVPAVLNDKKRDVISYSVMLIRR